jgi:hypothetical protein
MSYEVWVKVWITGDDDWEITDREDFKIKVSNYSADKVHGRPPKNKCRPNNEICIFKVVMAVVDKKDQLAFLAERTNANMNGFNKLNAEKEKHDVNEEAHLHAVFIFIKESGSNDSSTNVGALLTAARIDYIQIEDGSSFGVKLYAEAAKKKNF